MQLDESSQLVAAVTCKIILEYDKAKFTKQIKLSGKLSVTNENEIKLVGYKNDNPAMLDTKILETTKDSYIGTFQGYDGYVFVFFTAKRFCLVLRQEG